MKFGLEEKVLEKIINIFRNYSDITSVILFGSRAKGNFKPGSDIDLAIKGEFKGTDINLIREKLDELFLPQTFDLVLYEEITEPALIEHIDRVGIEVFRKAT